MCVSVCEARPSLGDKHRAPQTSRCITALLEYCTGYRTEEEVGARLGSQPIKYHICIKMLSSWSHRRDGNFKDACLKVVEVLALQAGIAPYRFSLIYWSHLRFIHVSRWSKGGCSSHRSFLNNMCLMMSHA